MSVIGIYQQLLWARLFDSFTPAVFRIGDDREDDAPPRNRVQKAHPGSACRDDKEGDDTKQ